MIKIYINLKSIVHFHGSVPCFHSVSILKTIRWSVIMQSNLVIVIYKMQSVDHYWSYYAVLFNNNVQSDGQWLMQKQKLGCTKQNYICLQVYNF